MTPRHASDAGDPITPRRDPEVAQAQTPEMGRTGVPAEAVGAPLDHRPGTSGVATPGGGWRKAEGPSAQKRAGRKRKGGGRRGGSRDGDPTVGDADFQSYYGRQIVKSAVWKTPDVPLYLFLGGLAGGSALLAEGAALSGNRRLEHLMRGVAAGVARATGTRPWATPTSRATTAGRS